MTTTQQQIKTLEKDISSLKNLLSEQIEEGPSNGLSKMSFNTDEIKHAANQAGKDVRSFFRKKQKQFANGKEKCESTIKERPLTSAFVTFAAGALLASMFKR